MVLEEEAELFRSVEKMSEENSEEIKMLELQMKHLQAEVEALQSQKEDSQKDMTFHVGGQMEEALAYVCGQTQGGGQKTVMSRLKEEVEELEEDLKLQTQMNGVNVKSCIRKTLQKSRRKLVQELRVSGHCSGLTFQVEFQLSEDNVGQRGERSVSHLNVVLDSGGLLSFNNFISRVEEKNDLVLFFTTLRTFTDRCDDRARTFQHFQEKFPSVVSVPGGRWSEVMSASHPELPGCVFFVRWSLQVSNEGAVTPNVNLLTKIPEQALQLFPSWSAGGAAEGFQSLLRILGPEAAIESIIRAVSLSLEI